MTESKEGRFPWYQVALVFLAILLAYQPALRAGFVFDDWILLVQHPLIHAADGLRRIWFTTEAPDYYPVTWTCWWWQWRLWGATPGGYHLVNVLLHAVNAVLLTQVLRRLAMRGAWLAGLIFAVHPVNVAVVAWISEQKTILALLFFLTTMLAYFRFERSERGSWYAVSIGCFALSLLAKPAAVMWPVVLLALIWWKRSRVTRRDLVRCLPFSGLSLVIAPVTVWFQLVRVLEGQAARTDSFLARLAGAGWSVWFYLWKAILPVRLCMLYPRWKINDVLPAVYLPMLLLVLVFVFLWWKRRMWGRAALTGASYFVVMLFPVLGFFDQGFYRFSFVADHWQYVPILGVIALIAGGSATAVANRPRLIQTLAKLTGALLIIVFVVLTRNQCRAYQSDETLWRDTIAKNPTAWLAHHNLGVKLAEQGRLAEAGAAFETALRLKPDYADAFCDLGMVLLREGKTNEAVSRWHEALRCRPDHVDSLNNLGAAYAQQADLKHAALYFSLVLTLKPNDPEAHANLGTVYLNQTKLEKAVAEFQAALQADPEMTQARLYLGIALARLGHFPQAREAFHEMLRRDPTNPVARRALEQLPAP